jgi:hypothetical protein
LILFIIAFFFQHNDTEWKWGEYPESKRRKEKDSKMKSDKGGESKTASGWRWFPWRSRTEPQEQQQEQGVYLGDLMNKDPNQLEKYFGTSAAR